MPSWREHELVRMTRKAHVQLPTDPWQPGRPNRQAARLWQDSLMGLTAAGIFLLGWRIEVPVLNWILMIAGGSFQRGPFLGILCSTQRRPAERSGAGQALTRLRSSRIFAPDRSAPPHHRQLTPRQGMTGEVPLRPV
jgi:hypothetical protein